MGAILGIPSAMAPKNAAFIQARYERLCIALRYFLQGAAQNDKTYLLPLRAFNQAIQTHVGTRKDGCTPEFMHQLETTLFLLTLRHALQDAPRTLAVQLLHDIAEDYDVTFESIAQDYDKEVSHGVRRMTKLYQGRKLALEVYFEDMLDSPLATLCKGADRIHNHQSMPGVFTVAKQEEYLNETEEYILPMLKKARRIYPDQEAAYENIKFVLTSQIELVRGMLDLQR